jgi:hypothetical protein
MADKPLPYVYSFILEKPRLEIIRTEESETGTIVYPAFHANCIFLLFSNSGKKDNDNNFIYNRMKKGTWVGGDAYNNIPAFNVLRLFRDFDVHFSSKDSECEFFITIKHPSFYERSHYEQKQFEFSKIFFDYFKDKDGNFRSASSQDMKKIYPPVIPDVQYRVEHTIGSKVESYVNKFRETLDVVKTAYKILMSRRINKDELKNISSDPYAVLPAVNRYDVSKKNTEPSSDSPSELEENVTAGLSSPDLASSTTSPSGQVQVLSSGFPLGSEAIDTFPEYTGQPRRARSAQLTYGDSVISSSGFTRSTKQFRRDPHSLGTEKMPSGGFDGGSKHNKRNLTKKKKFRKNRRTRR